MILALVLSLTAQVDVSSKMFVGIEQGEMCNYVWQTTDLPVRFHLKDASVDEQMILDSAADIFNKAFGKHLVTTTSTLSKAKVVIRKRDKLQEERNGEARVFQLLDSCYISHGFIDIVNGLSLVELEWVLVHEIGHTMGLLHYEGCSYMNEVVTLECTKFSKHHRYMLESLYGNRTTNYGPRP